MITRIQDCFRELPRSFAPHLLYGGTDNKGQSRNYIGQAGLGPTNLRRLLGSFIRNISSKQSCLLGVFKRREHKKLAYSVRTFNTHFHPMCTF
jgi:hypothetical protein